MEGRTELFRINLKSLELDADVDFAELAAKSAGYSGADVANVCRYVRKCCSWPMSSMLVLICCCLKHVRTSPNSLRTLLVSVALVFDCVAPFDAPLSG